MQLKVNEMHWKKPFGLILITFDKVFLFQKTMKMFLESKDNFHLLVWEKKKKKKRKKKKKKKNAS